MVKNFELYLGPKNQEHTLIAFDSDLTIHIAQVWSESLDEWVDLNDKQIARLADMNSIHRAMEIRVGECLEESAAV